MLPDDELLEELEDELLDDELEFELELLELEDELVELEEPHAPRLVHVPSLPGTELVYQLA